MLDLTKNIRSLTDFKRNTSELVENIKRTKHPIVLTVNGKAELVETLKGMKWGLDQMKQGEGRTVESFFLRYLTV
ncbi:MAG: type II toxin-antitoxin system prevent-host-death family antitoxin [Crocosphaera sp.]